MNPNLEQLAKDCGTKWTYSEVMAEVYHAVKDMPFAAGVVYLRGILSHGALASVQHAAQCIVRDKPEAQSFGVGCITPASPVNLDQIEQVPMEFVRYVSSTLIPPPKA